MGREILYHHTLHFEIPDVVERIRLGQQTSYGSLHPGIRRWFEWMEDKKRGRQIHDDLYELHCTCKHSYQVHLPLIGSAPRLVDRRCAACGQHMTWKLWLGWIEGYPEEARVGS